MIMRAQHIPTRTKVAYATYLVGFSLVAGGLQLFPGSSFGATAASLFSGVEKIQGDERKASLLLPRIPVANLALNTPSPALSKESFQQKGAESKSQGGELIKPTPTKLRVKKDPLHQWFGALSPLTKQALSSHPSILQGVASKASSEAQLGAARWQMAPTPSISRQYTYADQYQNTASIQQPLWDGGQIFSGIDAAEARVRAADFALQDMRRDLILRVSEAWGNWVRALRREREVSRLVTFYDDLLAMIARRVDQGVAPASDQDLAVARAQTVLADQAKSKNATLQARLVLEMLVGQEVLPDAEKALEGNPTDIPSRALLLDSLLKSPALSKASADIEAAEADLASRKASLQPTIFAKAEHLWGAVEDNRVWVGVQTALGAGLSNFSGIAAQQAQVNALKSSADSVRKNLLDTGNVEYVRYQNAQVDYLSTKKTLDNTQLVLESYQRQFIVGKRSWLEVLNMVQETHQARLTFVDSEIAARLAAYRIGVFVYGYPLLEN